MKLTFLSNHKFAPVTRRQLLNKALHLVVPVVLIKEMVLNNILYPSAVLESFVQTWNGVPVPVGHPQKDGKAVTANSAEVEESSNIGRIFNVEFSNNSVNAEIWINISKAEELGYGSIVTKLEEGEMIEVSTGLFPGVLNAETGEFNGKSYTHVIGDIRPDHLAILPNEVGACGIKDGCGAGRIPVTNCGCEDTPVRNRVVGLYQQFYTNANESHNQVRDALNRAVQSTLLSSQWAYVADVFDSFFVYELDSKLFKQTYAIDNGNAILVGERVEVKVKTSYVPVSAETVTNNMKPEKRNAIVAALALALVANASEVTEAHTKVFEPLDDLMLDNMAKAKGLNLDDDGKPIVAAPAATPPPLPVVANAAAPVALDAATVARLAHLDRLIANEAANLTNKRSKIVAAKLPGFTAEIVANMDEPALDAIIANIGTTPQGSPVFGLGGNVPATNTAEKRKRPDMFATATA